MMSIPGAKLSVRRLPLRWQCALQHSGSANPASPLPHAARRHLSITPKPRQNPQHQQPETAFSSSPSSSSTAKPAPPPASAANDPTDNTIPISIPGPSWLWVPLKPLSYPINAYTRAQNRRPYLTQFVSSLIIYFLGDLSSQLIQQPAPPVDPKPEDLPFHSHTPTTSPPPPHHQAQHAEAQPDKTPTPPTTPSSLQNAWAHYDPHRSLRAITIGGLFSIPSYHWFLYLSSLFPRSPHLLRLSLQVLISQAIFAPFFNSYFFGMHSLLSFDSPSPKEAVQKAWERIQATVPVSWWNSCKFWPVVTAVNFSFVRPRSRSVVAGCVAVVWQSYLGLVNQRAVRAERERERKEEGMVGAAVA